jgi:deferrochelatase/peroxidase EfeB
MSSEDRIQEGIYFRQGQRPPPCFRLLLLDVVPTTSRATAASALTAIRAMLDGLASGQLRDLAGARDGEVAASRGQFAGLTSLLAYGARLFDHDMHAPALTRLPRPDYLVRLQRDEAFPNLPWAATRAEGEADIALQLISDHAAGVNCAAVEVLKLMADERLPLVSVGTFAGFGRPDGRGWLDFHDGVSNIEGSQRLTALATPGDPGWLAGGTTMAFLRIGVDLAAWRAVPRAQQEIVVGRDKLTGAPLTAVDRSGERLQPVPQAVPEHTSSAEAHADYADPLQVTDPLVEASHTHRANQNRASPHAPAGLRIFRQGFDFLDGIGLDGPRLGLNFVSFQRDLAIIHHVMHLPGWLGDVNFGGPATPRAGEPAPPQLLELVAGGLYAVPPRSDPFPGAALFAELG